MMENSTWYLLTLRHPRKWKELLGKLEKNFGQSNVWIPTQDTEKIMRKKKFVSPEPIFSGYAFLRTDDVSEMTRKLREDLNEEAKVLGIGGGMISDSEMEETKEFAENLNPRTLSEGFSLDDKVRINSGPFRNFVGTVTKLEDRTCRLDLTIFGRVIPTTVELKSIEKI